MHKTFSTQSSKTNSQSSNTLHALKVNNIIGIEIARLTALQWINSTSNACNNECEFTMSLTSAIITINCAIT